MNNLTVIVRVWPSDKLNSGRNSTGVSGHVSLETHFGGDIKRVGEIAKNAVNGHSNGYYVSWWPGTCLASHATLEKVRGCKIDPIVCREEKAHFHTLKQDTDLQRTEPNAKSLKDQDDKLKETACRFELTMFTQEQVEKINAAFEQFSKEHVQWAKHGSRNMTPRRIRSCAGLVEDLLNQGGIYNFTSDSTQSFSKIMFGHRTVTILTGLAVLWTAYSIYSLIRNGVVGFEGSNWDLASLNTVQHRLKSIGSSATQLRTFSDTAVQSIGRQIQRDSSDARDFLSHFAGAHDKWRLSNLQATASNTLTIGLQGLGMAYGINKVGNYLQYNLVTPSDVAAIAESAKKQHEEEQKGKPTLEQQRRRKWALGGCTLGLVVMGGIRVARWLVKTKEV